MNNGKNMKRRRWEKTAWLKKRIQIRMANVVETHYHGLMNEWYMLVKDCPTWVGISEGRGEMQSGTNLTGVQVDTAMSQRMMAVARSFVVEISVDSRFVNSLYSGGNTSSSSVLTWQSALIKVSQTWIWKRFVIPLLWEGRLKTLRFVVIGILVLKALVKSILAWEHLPNALKP